MGAGQVSETTKEPQVDKEHAVLSISLGQSLVPLLVPFNCALVNRGSRHC